MSKYKKKVTLAKFTDERRQKGVATFKRPSKFNDGLNPTQRKQKKINKAANGCWWIKQYIMGTLSYRQDMVGVDDE